MSVGEQSTEVLTVSLGTPPTNQANAAAVASTMQAMVAIVEATQQELKSNDTLLVKARPFGKGSLEVELDIILVAASTLFDQHPLIEEIIRVLKQYFTFKILLQGKSPSVEELVATTGTVNISNSVVNVLNNSHVTTVVNQAATDIEKDETITYFELLKGKEREVLVRCDREQLKYLRSDAGAIDSSIKMLTRTVPVTVIIHTVVLRGKGQWTFIMDKHEIKAKVTHKEFLENVKRGSEKFAAGDRLEVKMEVREEFDERLATRVVKSRVITEVISHLPRPSTEQTKLPFGAE